MNRARFACAWALVIAGLAGAGCARSDNNTSAAERTAGETGRAATDDAAITTKVKSKMAAEARLSSLKDVGVGTQDGTVTLSGVVPSENEKKEAEQVARSVEGVTGVKNDLKVERASARDRAADRDRGDNTERTR